jgi:hypothetical protein
VELANCKEKLEPCQHAMVATFPLTKCLEKNSVSAMQNLGKFMKLSGAEQRCFLEAALWLTVFRVAVLCVPFRAIAGCMGRQRGETGETFPDAATMREVMAVARALRVVSNRLPWACTCLVQAAAGKCMLYRRGIPATLYLGVTKDEDQKVIAHAWLRSGDVTLTGEKEKERYTVICTFA